MQVVKAVSQQLGTLNTNARYLHNNLVMHAEMLAATMPDPLEVFTPPFPFPPLSANVFLAHQSSSLPLPGDSAQF